MIIKLYRRPKLTGWLGWIENCRGTAIGFIRLDGQAIFEW